MYLAWPGLPCYILQEYPAILTSHVNNPYIFEKYKHTAVHGNKSIEDFSLINKSVIQNTKLTRLSIPLQVKLTTYDTIVIFGVSEMVILYILVGIAFFSFLFIDSNF